MSLLDDQLESLIDQHGLHVVLESLADVAYAKAAHIHSNWQDTALADSVPEWMKLIGNADATHEGDSAAAARFILQVMGDDATHERVQQLSHALEAYASLLHLHGVMPSGVR